MQDLVQENVTVVADNHTEVRQWLSSLIELMEHIADGLWTVPVSRFPSQFEALSRDTVDTKRAHIIALDVVHEEAEKLVVLV